jgi:hypothetical protein
MWKANLNRHFAKLAPSLKISAFLILWSGLFHAFTLAILLFWSLTSNPTPGLNRMTTLNQFLSENQILFAAISSLAALMFFQDPLLDVWNARRVGLPAFLRSALRGAGFAGVMITALILNHDFEFLGLSTQVNLNFLAAYAWVFRSFLIFGFIGSTEFLVRVVVHREAERGLPRTLLETGTLLAIYSIWFAPKPSELVTLTLLFLVFNSFWSSTGFLAAFFILIHAVLGLNFFENETTGLLQLRSIRSEETLLQNPNLQAMLGILLVLIHYAKIRIRKESEKS